MQISHTPGNISPNFNNTNLSTNLFCQSVVVLLIDLVKNGDKMNVGLGTMGGVCFTDRKCTVNQDSGLDTAYTIVHELGHAYGI